jgi:hypothetical protein
MFKNQILNIITTLHWSSIWTFLSTWNSYVQYVLVTIKALKNQVKAPSSCLQALAEKGGIDPFIVVKNPSSSKGGVMEKYIKVSHYLTFINVIG